MLKDFVKLNDKEEYTQTDYGFYPLKPTQDKNDLIQNKNMKCIDEDIEIYGEYDA